MMARTDVYLDAMLRHLGAAYYESLHGRATRSDVTRALDTVEEHLGELAADRSPARASARSHPARQGDEPRRRRWARRVSDVMTTSVVTVDRITPYQEIDRLLTQHRISGVPVLMMGRQVAGVVSEADLLAAEDERTRRARMAATTGRRRLRRHPQASLTAGTLMTAPAITIGPDATIPAAARVMNTHHVRRLPVTDKDGKLVGIVSRRDLLSIFLRPDADIAHDVQEILHETACDEPATITVTVQHGVVTLTGTIEPAADRHHIIDLTIGMIWDVDGVVDVVNKLSEAEPAQTA